MPRTGRPELQPDPIAVFREWRREASASGAASLPDAMCLSTVDGNGTPHARFVDLKEVRDDGLVFCTSHASPKAAHIEANPKVALTVWWDHVKRQVRVSGVATRISEAEADALFQRRDREAQLASWAFEQSAELPGGVSPGDRLNDAAERFASGEVPRPPHWGGYVVVPDRIEFLVFEDSRAHRRVLYERQREKWTICELQP
ncbi:MAG TPA: pyridoxamine 5'-phosphate oxidase [Gemmatimonadota bacterium]|nr:pyridoxamine 5'-phosphate oxidase [Gemmatimonadota bacterium]